MRTRLQLGWLLGSVLPLAACGGPDLYINDRVSKRAPGAAPEAAGGGCMYAGDLHGTPVRYTPKPEAGDYGTFMTTGDGAVHFLVHSRGEVLARRRYDQAFLHGGQPDEFMVTTKAGIEYAFRFWGAPICDPPKSID